MPERPRIGAERKFLLDCGAAVLAGVSRAQGLAPPADLDWGRVYHSAKLARLFPQLRLCVEAHRHMLPMAIWNALQAKTDAISHHNRILTSELLELLDYFEGEGCPVLPYKGPALASLAYGDIGLRTFSDLDLLIPRASMGQGSELLLRRGYRVRHRSHRAADAVHLRTEYHYTFDSADGSIAVELHGEAIPCYLSFPITNEELWARREDVQVEARAVPSVSREDMALLLAMHGTKHEWQCLELVLGLAGLLRASPALRWDHLMQRAESLGARRVLLLGLSLAESFFEYCPPKEIRDSIGNDAVVQQLTMQVWEYYAEIRQPASSAVQTLQFHSRSRERFPDKMRYFLLKLFAPNWEEVEWLPLPRPLFPLYWVLRPVRLVLQYGPELLGLAEPRASSRQCRH